MEKDILVRFEDVLKFYPIDRIHQQKNALDYIKVKELRERTGFGARKISKIINVSEGTVNHWLIGKNTPRAVKGIKQLESMGLLPLKISDSRAFCHFLRTLGLRYSDGCIYEQKRNNTLTFYLCFGDKDDALKFVKDSKNCWDINLEIHQGTNAYYIYLPASLARLMLSVGSIKGDKTTQNFGLPKWILNLTDNLKAEFLSGLFSGDADTPRLKSSGRALESLRLSLSSEKSISKEFSESFMKDIFNLIISMGIKATSPSIKYNQPRVSKNGRVTYPIYIRILTERQNITRFLQKIKYTYRNKAVKNTEIILNKLTEI